VSARAEVESGALAGRPRRRARLRRERRGAEFDVPRTGTLPIRTLARLAEQILMVLIAFVSLAPLYAMVVTSLKTTQDFNLHPGSVAPPTHPHFSKYVEAWNDLGFSTMMKNSLILSIVSSVLTTALAAVAGFALSRLHFRGRRLVLVAMIAFMSVPAIAIVVPLFLVMVRWGLINTYVAAPVAEIGLSLPFAIYLVYTFMVDIPEELFSAAAVDGASPLQQLIRIAIPLSRPVLLTVALITGIFAWNDLLIPLVLWQSQGLQVLMVGLANLAPGHTGAADVPLLMAGVSISVLPVIVLFLLARRLFVQGFLGGAVKG
jgi:ABC-type glycerol-3-phosphate transport system permease component